MNTEEQFKEDIEQKDKSRFLTFLVFLFIATALWLIIKLSKEYTTQGVVNLVYTEVPVNKWISTPEQTLKYSFVADGFVILSNKMVPSRKRVVSIPLNQVPYRLEGGFTYSISSQYVVERLADWLNIPAGSITVNEDKQYFNMEDLQSRQLPVAVPLDVQTQRQYQLYGDPEVTPDVVTVYGPKNLLDTLTRVYSLPVSALDVSETFRRTVSLDLMDGAIRSEVDRVDVVVPVEQYTERDLEVPVAVDDSLELRFFPETVRLKCMVPICDYASIGPSSFQVLVDTAQLHRLQPLLDVRLVKTPAHVQVLKMEPSQVEYLIIH